MLTINAENIEIIFLTEINENDLVPVMVYKDGRPTAEVKPMTRAGALIAFAMLLFGRTVKFRKT